jgi:hypothetical protein
MTNTLSKNAQNVLARLSKNGNHLQIVRENSSRSIENIPVLPPVNVKPETDEQIEKRIEERFAIYRQLIKMTIAGDSRSLIVSGPPGLGKTFDLESALEDEYGENYHGMITSGFIRPTGVYRRLYENRERGQLMAIDDTDSVLENVDSLNLMKKACDTIDRRFISWGSETTMRDDETGDKLPTRFEYCGSLIILTNNNLDDIVTKGAKNADHISAMISRSHYIDLGMRTKRDYFVRVRQVIRNGMLDDILSQDSITEVVDYIETNLDRLREVSLRIAHKISKTMVSAPATWDSICNATCCKPVR